MFKTEPCYRILRYHIRDLNLVYSLKIQMNICKHDLKLMESLDWQMIT